MIQNREMAGVISTPLHPFSTQNLPGTFDIRGRLEPGGHASDPDMCDLPDNVSDAILAKPGFHGDPELARVGGKSVTLCRGMPLQALDTECSLPV
jgi:hypothetical protein